MSSAAAAGVVSQPCPDGKTRFWEVWSHRLAGEPADARLAGEPVLLIHAAALSREMFLVRDGGFVKALLEVEKAGQPRFDVLTLDWRGSKYLLSQQGGQAQTTTFDDYRVDKIADDVQAGIGLAARRHGGAPVHVVAHCMGAAATAQAIATQPQLAAQLGHVVLATIGLFYRVGLDGVLKTAENIMEGVEAQGIHAIAPQGGAEWPVAFREMYEMWLHTIFPHGCGLELCNRLWFMFGGDYRSEDMEDIHQSEEHLSQLFGPMPVGLYRHIIDNCRRGWAATFTNRSVLNAEPFRDLSLLLITGNENQVWHRDSIDRMHEWLRRELAQGAARIDKRVFDRYGHLDLWWSADSKRRVFTTIIERLTR